MLGLCDAADGKSGRFSTYLFANGILRHADLQADFDI